MFKHKKKRYPRRYSSYRSMNSGSKKLNIWQRTGIAMIILILVAIPVLFSGRFPGKAQPFLKDVFLNHFSVQDLSGVVTALTNGKINAIETLSPAQIEEPSETIMTLNEIPNLSLPVVGRIAETNLKNPTTIHIIAVEGYPVVAVLSGKVIDIRGDAVDGMSIEIDHGRGLKTIYGSLGALAVTIEDEVKKGDIIGRVGKFGRDSGIDFEVMLVDEYLEPDSLFQSK